MTIGCSPPHTPALLHLVTTTLVLSAEHLGVVVSQLQHWVVEMQVDPQALVPGGRAQVPPGAVQRWQVGHEPVLQQTPSVHEPDVHSAGLEQAAPLAFLMTMKLQLLLTHLPD